MGIGDDGFAGATALEELDETEASTDEETLPEGDPEAASDVSPVLPVLEMLHIQENLTDLPAADLLSALERIRAARRVRGEESAKKTRGKSSRKKAETAGTDLVSKAMAELAKIEDPVERAEKAKAIMASLGLGNLKKQIAEPAGESSTE